MLNEIKCNVWNLLDENSAVCILTNDTVYEIYDAATMTKFKKNVMGGGIAREARDRNANLEYICAEAILSDSFSLGIDELTGAEMLRFSTKQDVKNNSDLYTIEKSLCKLKEYIENNPNKKIYLPRPGCGLGGLNWDNVKYLCENYLGTYSNVFILYK